MYLALLTLHLIGIVGFNLRLRTSLLDKVEPLLLAAVLQLAIAIPLLPVLVLNPPDARIFTSPDIFYLLAGIALTISLQISNTMALKHLEASVFSIIYNLRIPITTVLGILFLNEEFIWTRIIGGMLIFSAIFIVQQRGKHSLTRRGVEWGAAAVLSISFLNLSEKTLINSGGLWYYFPMQSVAAAIILGAYVWHKGLVKQPKLLVNGSILQLMVLRAMSAFGFSGALAAGAMISVANYISGMSVLLIMVGGIILLGEKDYLQRKLFALLVAVIGLTIILIGAI